MLCEMRAASRCVDLTCVLFTGRWPNATCVAEKLAANQQKARQI